MSRTTIELLPTFEYPPRCAGNGPPIRTPSNCRSPTRSSAPTTWSRRRCRCGRRGRVVSCVLPSVFSIRGRWNVIRWCCNRTIAASMRRTAGLRTVVFRSSTGCRRRRRTGPLEAVPRVEVDVPGRGDESGIDQRRIGIMGIDAGRRSQQRWHCLHMDSREAPRIRVSRPSSSPMLEQLSGFPRRRAARTEPRYKAARPRRSGRSRISAISSAATTYPQQRRRTGQPTVGFRGRRW